LNFLLHRHLAARDLESDIAGIGAMLPDLWRMADRRVRPAPIPGPTPGAGDLASILAGIEHHLRLDRWFHGADVFVVGERLTSERLRASRIEAAKVGLFAHIGWELCLDGALVRQEGLESTLGLLRDGFAAAGAPAGDAVSLHHFERLERTPAERQAFDAGMTRLFTEIARGPWIAGYRSGDGVAGRIGGIRVRLGFPRLSTDDRRRLGDVFDGLAAHADVALAALLEARTTAG
jgi:hypothetical protein